MDENICGMSSNISDFLNAVCENIPPNKKQYYGKRIEFVCPICKGKAYCIRSRERGQVRARCSGCGFTIIE